MVIFDNGKMNTKSILRFSATGSVDDGKSTLIGRLLFDSDSVFTEQLKEVESVSARKGFENPDLSLFTDGLKEEREQGITIDVAYRYFSTSKRKFILADTPGHLKYLRNMVTGVSNSDLSFILIDAEKGISEQTRRHTFLAHMLRIPFILVCVNKMDSVKYDEAVYEKIVREFKLFSSVLNIQNINFIPLSALKGDNVVEKSNHLSWYTGPTLLNYLETIPIYVENNTPEARFPVQGVFVSDSPHESEHTFFAGRVAGGVFQVGDHVWLSPSLKQSKIQSILTYDGKRKQASAGESVLIRLEDDSVLKRGDIIFTGKRTPESKQVIDVMICWFSETSLESGKKYILRQSASESEAVISEVKYKIEISSFEKNTGAKELLTNDIGLISIRTTYPLFFDSYSSNKITGSIILIDPETNETAGVGMIA